MPSKKQYWLMKTEPGVYSIDDLKRDGKTYWEGVRNYQARNMMRDQMKIGDRVLFYHSQVKPIGIYGLAEIASEGYPDPTAFDAETKYFDAKSDPANPTWMVVDVAYVAHLDPPVTLDDLKQTPGLEKMMVIQRGSRLSIQPVTPEEWKIVLSLTKQVS